MNIVQVVGGPGSGKTTLAHALLDDWPGAASLLRIDRYLRDRTPDDGLDFLLLPDSIDWPLMELHLGSINKRQPVIMPLYDWQTGRRLPLRLPAPEGHLIVPCDWLVIEGLYYVPEIESVRLFVDAPSAVQQARAAARDTSLSTHLPDGEWAQVIEPVYRRLIAPQREQADHVLDGTLDRHTLARQARHLLAAHFTGWG